MIVFGMSEEIQPGEFRRVFTKLNWLSRVLGEVDEWLESTAPAPGTAAAVGKRELLSVENLDRHIAREKTTG